MVWQSRTAQIREPSKEVWQIVIWKRRVSAIYSFTGFIYSESTTYLVRDIWQNKILRVFPEVVKMVRKFPEFSRFSQIIFFPKKFPFPGFPWAVWTLAMDREWWLKPFESRNFMIEWVQRILLESNAFLSGWNHLDRMQHENSRKTKISGVLSSKTYASDISGYAAIFNIGWICQSFSIAWSRKCLCNHTLWKRNYQLKIEES